MQKFLPYIVAAVLIGVCLLAAANYRADRKGQLLYAEYFDPQMGIDYGTTRALITAAPSRLSDRDEAVFQEAIRAHQLGEYGIALAAANDLLATNGDFPDQLRLIAGTAAMATGRYDASYFREIDPTDPAATWFSSLLLLRGEELDAAKMRLEQLAHSPGGGFFPVRELLTEI